MNMEIAFPGGKRVDAQFKGFTVKTDQPKEDGGDGTASEPFDLFLASIGTCAGIYALSFCQARDIDPKDLRMDLQFHENPKTRLMEKIEIRMILPPNFPKEYTKAIVRSTRLCSVKKQMDRPPEFEITAEIEGGWGVDASKGGDF
jgi:ribosomal protein S12 methylthiotransferase accessory factor